MDNKLSELSRPVDICNWKMDSWRAAPCNGTEWAKGYFEGWNKYHQKVEGLAPLYSQEYVSALLADNEAKDKRIANLEFEQGGYGYSVLEDLNGKIKRIAELEAKLATPVRLKKVDSSNVPFAGDGFNAAVDYCAKAVRAAGFTVEADE